MTSIVALVPDLMDRSRLMSACTHPIDFVPTIDDGAPVVADLVIVDIARTPDLAAVRRAAPRSRIIAFGPHVDDEAFALAQKAGIDTVLARSQFFRQLDVLLR